LAALAKAEEPLSRAVLQAASGLRNREHFVNQHLNPLVIAGLLELTVSDKPRSSKQRYRLTDAGRAYLKKN
jgi:ATP-dependent DNA helicase RecG